MFYVRGKYGFFQQKDVIMNKIYTALLFAVALVGSVSAANVEPAQALAKLQEGNQRYVNSTTVCHDDWTAKRTALVQNQTPFAVIVSCSDSRVPPELVFDQTLGALFVVRVAGNIVDDFAIGSIEYGVKVLGANLVLVLDSKCVDSHPTCGRCH
jgi:carbonic anhydrase